MLGADEGDMASLKQCVVSYFAFVQEKMDRYGAGHPGATPTSTGLEKVMRHHGVARGYGKGFEKPTADNPKTMEKHPTGGGLKAFLRCLRETEPDLKVLVRRYFEQFGDTLEGL